MGAADATIERMAGLRSTGGSGASPDARRKMAMRRLYRYRTAGTAAGGSSSGGLVCTKAELVPVLALPVDA